MLTVLKRHGASVLLCAAGLFGTILLGNLLRGQPWAQRALYSYSQVLLYHMLRVRLVMSSCPLQVSHATWLLPDEVDMDCRQRHSWQSTEGDRWPWTSLGPSVTTWQPSTRAWCPTTCGPGPTRRCSGKTWSAGLATCTSMLLAPMLARGWSVPA